MAKLIFEHSEDWLEKLTVPRDELSSSEREAIANHLAACPSCYSIVAENTRLARLIQDLPVPDFPSGLPSKLRQLLEEEDRNRKKQNKPGVHGANRRFFEFDSVDRKRVQQAAEEILSREEGYIATTNDLANELALRPGMSRKQFITEYIRGMTDEGSGKIATRREAVSALARLEQSYGASIGSVAMRVTAYMAAIRSLTSYG